MKKFTALSLFLFVFFAGKAQKINTDYHLKHNIKQDNQQFEFHVLDFDDKGVYQYDKDKFYFWLKAQQVHATQGYSSGLLLHGEFQAFYVNKQLAQRGYFYKGLKNAEWLYWNSEGTLTHIEHWRSGAKVGTEKTFSDDGQLIEQVKYKLFKTVRKTGDSTIVTRNKKQQEEITIRDAYGHKSKIIRSKNGQLHGKQVEYKEGKAEIERYKNGQKVEEKPEAEKTGKEKGEKKTLAKRLKNLFPKKDKNASKKPAATPKSKGKKEATGGEKKKGSLFSKKEKKSN